MTLNCTHTEWRKWNTVCVDEGDQVIIKKVNNYIAGGVFYCELCYIVYVSQAFMYGKCIVMFAFP